MVAWVKGCNPPSDTEEMFDSPSPVCRDESRLSTARVPGGLRFTQ